MTRAFVTLAAAVLAFALLTAVAASHADDPEAGDILSTLSITTGIAR